MTDQTASALDDDEATGNEDESERVRWPTRRLFILGSAGLAVVAGAGIGAGSWFGLAGDEGPAPQAPPTYLDLPEITVNLNTTGDHPRYLRINAALEFQDERVTDQIEPVLPRVLDTFQVYLRELRITDLEGSAGLYRLKEELVRRVNMAIHPAEIDGVVFKELIVQ